ncbi:MAG: hypothetical protein KC587_16120 [Nitrospira sp.]|nr:hypothetical protein [Nitrospira sp.]MCA9458194.1 hypothetical protein [Nitrospira sp.]
MECQKELVQLTQQVGESIVPLAWDLDIKAGMLGRPGVVGLRDVGGGPILCGNAVWKKWFA